MKNFDLGIDPGLEGAIVGLIDGVPQPDMVIRASKVQVDTSSVSKNRLDAIDLINRIDEMGFGRARYAFCEDPNAMKKNGLTRIKTQFETIGAMKALLEINGIKVVSISANNWKRYYGLSKQKKRASVERLQELFPGFEGMLIKDADIAEAALIGRYGYRKLQEKQ